MADAATAESAATTPEKSDRSKKLIIIAVLVVLASAGGFFATKVMAAPAAATPEVEPTPVEGEVIEVAEMTASLNGEVPHLARVGFAVVLEESADPTVVQPKFPLLKDAAVTELAESSADVLITPEGVDDLRQRLTDRAHEIYPEGEIVRVVLTQLIVQ